MNKYISQKEKQSLSRKIHPLPSYIEKDIKTNKLEKIYASRPTYQKNDYIGWITRAKRPETKSKRLEQMIEELKEGKKYMKMDFHV